MKRGPERALVDDYLDRAGKTGRGIGIRSVSEVEVPAGSSGAEDAASLRARIPDGAFVVAFDETGEDMTSLAFADLLASQRDSGTSDMALVIGGADGFSEDFRANANKLVRFGRLTWPHKLARVLVAEQTYRAVSVMAGTPYHREGSR